MAQQQTTIQQALQLAWQHQRAGRLAEAESVYRQILSAHPNQPDALHLLGTLALMVGRNDAALQLFDRAITASPHQPHFHSNRAEALTRLGRFAEAIAACKQALSIDADFAEAMVNLGSALRKSGQMQDAIGQFRTAIRVRPAFLQAYYNLTAVLQEIGQLNEAIDVLKKAIALQPTYAEAINNLGSLLHSSGRYAEAVATFRQALALRPQLPEAHFNLANALRDVGEIDDAIAGFNRAIQLRPNFPEAFLNLGLAYQDQRRQELAIAQYRQAIALRPEFGQAHNNLGDRLRIVGHFDESIAELKIAASLLPAAVEVYSNLGNAYQDIGRLDDATAAYKKAIELSPQNPAAHHNFSLALLMGGNLQAGWPEYEWRRKVKRLANSQFDLPIPIWDGSDLKGKQILIHAEQGLGDTIHFARFIPMVANRGGRVILACQPELKRLLGNLEGASEVIATNEALPPFDTHCPLPGLPARFQTSLQTIPAEIPYVKPDPALVDEWNERLSNAMLSDARLKVGLAWAGRAIHENDHNRSLDLQRFLPILSQHSIARFISLQIGAAAAEVKQLPREYEVLDLTAFIHDFADTAALIANLDLVICVDTSVAHLAGAMGKAVWVLIPMNPDWRWMLNRTDSPWYPTMRLFRQNIFQDWSQPVAEIAEAIGELAI